MVLDRHAQPAVRLAVGNTLFDEFGVYNERLRKDKVFHTLISVALLDFTHISTYC